MTITWIIQQLDRLTSDGFVTTAYWRATAVDGKHSDSIYSTCFWSEGTPTIAYEELTEEQVLGWIWANGVDKDAIEAALLAQIEMKKNPIQQTGVPW
jgi:hypothetical protein